MLKQSEIKALSHKMNFDIRTMKHCLKDVFSKDSSVINNDTVTNKDVAEFLRICAFSKTKEERKNSFYRSFLPRFAAKDPRKTVVHFIRDYFFAAMLAYLDEIEGKRFEQRFEYEELDNENTFYFTMLGTEHMNTIFLKEKKNEIVGNLLAQILDSRDLGSDIDPERNYIINLSSEIAQDVGYRMFVVDMISEAFADSEEMGRFKGGLDKTSYNLMSHGKDKRLDYIFIYCVCESLRARGFKPESVYKALNKIIFMGDRSIRRRYYQVKSEMIKKALHYKTLIKMYDLEYRIYITMRDVESTLTKSD